MTTDEKHTDLFKPVGGAAQAVDNAAEDDDHKVVDEIESLCMNCHDNGITKLLLTMIPFFKEVIVMSFECEHCGFKNSEIQSAGQIQERGCRYKFTVNSMEELSRQVVKSETCTVSIPALSLEVPAQRGKLTTVEGVLSTVLEDLLGDQEKRKDSDPENWTKIEEFITKGKDMLEGRAFPWDIKLDDPSGNSWVEPSTLDPRGKWVRTDYVRTREQNEMLALSTDGADADADNNDAPHVTAGGAAATGDDEYSDIKRDEVYTFPATCPSCTHRCDTHMKMVDIPHFTEVVIMSTVCDACGYKSNEVKTGGSVPSKGRRIKLKVTDSDDMARDILKSETCALSIPEINLDLTPGTLGGRFTTLEGLLSQVYDELHGRIFTETQDSMEAEARSRWVKFFEGLKEAIEAKREFTVILEDPLAASYLQNLYAPDPDPNLTIEDYDRTEEQDEDLGLADMKVENYQEDNKEEEGTVASS